MSKTLLYINIKYTLFFCCNSQGILQQQKYIVIGTKLYSFSFKLIVLELSFSWMKATVLNAFSLCSKDFLACVTWIFVRICKAYRKEKSLSPEIAFETIFFIPGCSFMKYKRYVAEEEIKHFLKIKLIEILK